jgi:hypothetical protein
MRSGISATAVTTPTYVQHSKRCGDALPRWLTYPEPAGGFTTRWTGRERNNGMHDSATDWARRYIERATRNEAPGLIGW